ncbi:TPA: hypothetical protein QFV56_004643 [Klebsiella pneumoniae]|nr:MAG TPA: hypothetical protein [Caudoviricetes sp.]HDK6299215.1 hypothetical protein [Klebsiella pneumoniae]HDT6494114.1 hypothetical protein [Klebsiella pneumoniae]HDT6555682.1 hypothetical protein [Raoultella ornithinolytica]
MTVTGFFQTVWSLLPLESGNCYQFSLTVRDFQSGDGHQFYQTVWSLSLSESGNGYHFYRTVRDFQNGKRLPLYGKAQALAHIVRTLSLRVNASTPQLTSGEFFKPVT